MGISLAADTLLREAKWDQGAFASFYDLSKPKVTRFFDKRVHCRDTGADLTSDTFERSWSARHRFDPSRGTAIGWTLGIAGNVHRQWVERMVTAARATSAFTTHAAAANDGGFADIDSSLDATAVSGGLQRALDELTPTVRLAVVLRVANDLPYELVARYLGCSVGTARTRVSRGLESLLRSSELHF